MVEAISFALAVFIGWVIFDFVKHKQFKKEHVLSALTIGIIAGIGWFVLGLFLP